MPRSSAAEAMRTKAAIVDAAVDRAAVEGLENLRVRALADDLGLSKAGVLGPFGSKEELQLAALAHAMDAFRANVYEPTAHDAPGIERLRAIVERWIAYNAGCPFGGGCFMTTAAVEWDARPGRLRDTIATTHARWLAALAADARAAGFEDPEQIAFELNGIAMTLNQSVVLHEDPRAADRARRAAERVLSGRGA